MSDKIRVVCPHCGAVNNVPQSRLGDNPVCGKCKKPLFTGQPLELTENGFNRFVEKSDQPILVDFWAPWCGPCKMMAPVFAQAAQQLEPHFRLVKINTEDERNLAARMRIQSIPTLAIFKGGREIVRQPGAMDLGSLVNWARQYA